MQIDGVRIALWQIASWVFPTIGFFQPGSNAKIPSELSCTSRNRNEPCAPQAMPNAITIHEMPRMALGSTKT